MTSNLYTTNPKLLVGSLPNCSVSKTKAHFRLTRPHKTQVQHFFTTGRAFENLLKFILSSITYYCLEGVNRHPKVGRIHPAPPRIYTKFKSLNTLTTNSMREAGNWGKSFSAMIEEEIRTDSLPENNFKSWMK